jgi:hypothetical protein
MEWRAIVAVALSIFVLILWQYVLYPCLIHPTRYNARAPGEAGSETKAPPLPYGQARRTVCSERGRQPCGTTAAPLS